MRLFTHSILDSHGTIEDLQNIYGSKKVNFHVTPLLHNCQTTTVFILIHSSIQQFYTIQMNAFVSSLKNEKQSIPEPRSVEAMKHCSTYFGSRARLNKTHQNNADCNYHICCRTVYRAKRVCRSISRTVIFRNLPIPSLKTLLKL